MRDRLIIEQFDDEFILYNKLSGDTHVLNQESKLIIDTISFHPSSAAEVQYTVVSNALTSADISVAQIQQHLAILEQWGIAQRVR
jgi:PqqD family protein of HPr-rel-A system